MSPTPLNLPANRHKLLLNLSRHIFDDSMPTSKCNQPLESLQHSVDQNTNKNQTKTFPFDFKERGGLKFANISVLLR